MIIILVGLPSSGKSFAAEMLGRMGFYTVSSGDIIREEIRQRGMEYSKETDRKMADWFYKEGREPLIVERLLEKAESNLVIEGLRSVEDIEELKRRNKKFVIIAIESSFDSRLEREKKRERFPGFSKKDLEERDMAELRLGVGKLMKMADYVIDNTNLTKEELRKKLIDVLEDINI